MTFCFLSALNAEIQYLLDCSTIEKEEQLGFAKLYTLNYKDVRYFVCVSGVGKVLSGSAATACCIAHPEIDAFINIGIGGSLDASKAPLLSAILGSSFVQHDMDTSALGDPFGYLDGLKCIEIPADPVLNQKIEQACAALNIGFCRGVIASGDHFIADQKGKDVIIERFHALLIDMETAAFAEACFVYHKPFACVRIVSDAVDHDVEYWQNKRPAGKRGAEVALCLLRLENGIE